MHCLSNLWLDSDQDDCSCSDCLDNQMTDSERNDGTNNKEDEEGNWVIITPCQYFKPLNYSTKEGKAEKPSIQQPLVLEMKSLPRQLRYVYLRPNDTFPVIISSTMQPEQEQELITTLR
ncbi:hypothetical protein V6N13_109386 [Hibiscus sabdariffa]